MPESIITWIIITVYFSMLTIATLYLLKQLYCAFIVDKHPQVRSHRMEHVKLLILIALFNLTLLGTDLSTGVDTFLLMIGQEFGAMPMQYIVMSLFLFFAIEHLDYEIKDLEKAYDG